MFTGRTCPVTKMLAVFHTIEKGVVKINSDIESDLKWIIKKFIPDKIYLQYIFYTQMRTKLNLKKPRTFNEKLQWLKLYDRNPLYTQLVDKYAVREYIANTIGKEFLIPLIGVYDTVEDIDFDKLPNEFVLKCTHDSGSVIICEDKSRFCKNEAREKLTSRLKRNFYHGGREWPYKNIRPRIICEELLSSNIYDYKIFCFNGETKFLYISQGLTSDHSLRVDFFDLSWNKMPFKRRDYDSFDNLVDKPEHFDMMLNLAKKLSSGIPFVRIDLYEVFNQIYFSEFTLTPCSGFMPFDPPEYDMIIGNWLKLPKKYR